MWRLPFRLGLVAVDLPLLLEDLLGNLLRTEIAGRGSRDVHGQFLSELHKIIAVRREIGLAIELHQNPDLAAVMDVGGYPPLHGLASPGEELLSLLP